MLNTQCSGAFFCPPSVILIELLADNFIVARKSRLVTRRVIKSFDWHRGHTVCPRDATQWPTVLGYNRHLFLAFKAVK